MMKVMALGGVERIGSSCYYLELAGQRFLLDCGKGGYGSCICNPDLDVLLRTELISLNELDGILLTHGHYDHVGFLPELRRRGCDAPAYATGMTVALMDALLVDKLVYRAGQTAWERVSSLLHNEEINRMIRPVAYFSPIQKGEVKITFYPAGHIPGAAMIYLESPEGNVLYTGDFQKYGYALTDGYHLPERIKTDVMILCGTHARHPNHVPGNLLSENEQKLRLLVKDGRRVHIRVSQLTKGLETACWIAERIPEAKIYLDDHTWNLAVRMEQVDTPVMQANFYREEDGIVPVGSITIGGRAPKPWEKAMNLSPSLHASYDECLELIRDLNPKTVFLVHTPEDTRGVGGNSALQRELPEVWVEMPDAGVLYTT